MEDRINKILSELLRIPYGDINNNISMDDFDIWDSLSHMELVVSIEEEFKIELTADEIVAMQNVGEIKRIILDRVGD